jgi:hypothetical protein
MAKSPYDLQYVHEIMRHSSTAARRDVTPSEHRKATQAVAALVAQHERWREQQAAAPRCQWPDGCGLSRNGEAYDLTSARYANRFCHRHALEWDGLRRLAERKGREDKRRRNARKKAQAQAARPERAIMVRARRK